MFKNVLEYFQDLAAEMSWDHKERTARDLRIACCILFVETALVDEHYVDAEFNAMIAVLLENMRIENPDEAAQYVGLAECARQRRTKVSEVVGVIRSNFSEQDRRTIYGLVWKVIKADGKVHSQELRLVSELGKRLGLSLEQELEVRRELANEG